MTTLKQLAAAAGVSRTTASNAYNRPERLSAAVRERVLATARDLGYPGPDPTARSLRTGHVGAIGVLLAEALAFAFDDPAAVLLFRGIAETGELSGVGMTLVPAPPEQPTDATAVTRAVVDGFLVYHLPDGHPGMAAVLARGLPTVVVDGPELGGVSFVAVDDRGGARRAAEHLLALGAIEAAGKRGLPVPGGLAVTGFDDLPAAAGAGLTTVHQPLAEKGRVAAHLLLDALAGATRARRVELPTRLVVRGSTAPPRA